MDRYYIEFYAGGLDHGYVSYDNDPTYDLDNAMFFDSEHDANVFLVKHANRWKATLIVVLYHHADLSDDEDIRVSDFLNFFKVDKWCKNHSRNNDRFVTVIESHFKNLEGDLSDGR